MSLFGNSAYPYANPRYTRNTLFFQKSNFIYGCRYVLIGSKILKF